MSAELNRAMTDFVILFQETWAECEALRNKDRIEASGHRTNWKECLEAAQSKAGELFQPLLSALENNVPLLHYLEQTVEQLKAAQS